MILDIYLILSLYDNYNYHWSPKWTLEKVEALLQQSETKCPCCGGFSDNMYIISNRLCTGTAILGDIVPKRYLKFLTSLYQKGDVVDCEGYRGTGLYLFDGIEFKQIPTETYHPIVPLEYNKLRGYTYYWNIVGSCDLLLFENNVVLVPGDKFYLYDCSKIKLIDENDKGGEYYWPKDDEAEDKEDDEIDEVITNKFKEIAYPFSDVKLLNRCLNSKQLYRAKLNEKETMVLGEGYCVIYHINGDKINVEMGEADITEYMNIFDEKQQKLQLLNIISSYPSYDTNPYTQDDDQKEWERLFEYSRLYEYIDGKREKLLQLLSRQFDIPFATLLKLTKHFNWDTYDDQESIADFVTGQFRDDLEVILIIHSDKLTASEKGKIKYALENYL